MLPEGYGRPCENRGQLPAYPCNAYADFKGLILTLEQTNARIQDYYTIQVKKASTRIYHDFFDICYGDIVRKGCVSTLVEDSLKRFRILSPTILEALLQEEALKAKIVDSAVSQVSVRIQPI